MSKPGTRFFIGPLTEAQQRRRQRSRENFRKADEIASARNIPMNEALKVVWEHTCNPWTARHHFLDYP